MVLSPRAVACIARRNDFLVLPTIPGKLNIRRLERLRSHLVERESLNERRFSISLKLVAQGRVAGAPNKDKDFVLETRSWQRTQDA